MVTLRILSASADLPDVTFVISWPLAFALCGGLLLLILALIWRIR